MKRYGLFVGVNNYSNGITPLQCARGDASALYKMFLSEGYDIELLIDSEASQENVIAQLRKIEFKFRKGDVFVFYFSGHGCEINGSHYLLSPAADAGLLNHQIGLIPVSLISELTAQPGVQRLFILDSCRSDVFASHKGLDTCPQSRSLSLKRLTDENPSGGTILPPLILTSCGTGEKSFENPKEGRGIFTSALLDTIDNPQVNSFTAFQNELKSAVNSKIAQFIPGQQQTVCWNGDVFQNIPLFAKWHETVSTPSIAVEKKRPAPEPFLMHGKKYFEDHEYEKAVAHLKRCSGDDWAEAGYYLGQCFLYGLGVPANTELALTYFNRSASVETGAGTIAEYCAGGSLYFCGLCYEYGIGVEVNFEEAYSCYHRSAQLGNEHGMVAFGFCNQFAIGMGEPDLVEAVHWYQKGRKSIHPYGTAYYYLLFCLVMNRQFCKKEDEWLNVAKECAERMPLFYKSIPWRSESLCEREHSAYAQMNKLSLIALEYAASHCEYPENKITAFWMNLAQEAGCERDFTSAFFEQFQAGAPVRCHFADVRKNVAYCELAPGVIGVIRIYGRDNNNNNISDLISAGKYAECTVISKDAEKRLIILKLANQQ